MNGQTTGRPPWQRQRIAISSLLLKLICEGSRVGYPIVWGLAEGANVITSQAEAGSYAGLDIAAKVIFGWMIMLGLGPLHKVQDEEEVA